MVEMWELLTTEQIKKIVVVGMDYFYTNFRNENK
jgi:hypothetical protein